MLDAIVMDSNRALLPCGGLSDDIWSRVFSGIDQNAKANVSRVNSRFYRLVKPHLYANIYITSIKYSPRTFRERSDAAAACELSHWSVVSFSVTESDAFKQLEYGLSQPHNAGFVDKLVTDDISFVLFKLKFWHRRFFRTKGPRSVYFGNVATNHFSTGYDDLFRFYVDMGATAYRLTHIQMRSVSELSVLLRDTDVSRFHNVALNFHITDIGQVSVDAMDEQTAILLRLFFTHISELRVLSVHNLGGLFLHSLGDVLGPNLFPKLRTFAFNHIHGQTNGMDPFNFNSLYDLTMERPLALEDFLHIIDPSLVETLEVSVGCNHIFCPRNGFLPDDIQDHDYCECLADFFKLLAASIPKFYSLKNLMLLKMGQLIVENPYSMFHYKQVVIAFLQSLPKLARITINTNATPYPYHEVVADMRFRLMAETFNQQNKRLYRALMRKCIQVEYVDYFESVHLWIMATAKTDSCGCKQCQSTKNCMFEFANMNRQIQFYLNPSVVRSSYEYFHDLVVTVCDILRRSYYYRSPHAVTSNSLHAGVSPAKAAAARQVTTPEPPVFAIMKIVADQNFLPQVSLHNLFAHNNYKQLICPAHNSVERARCWAPELTCQCDGTEIETFAQYIQHQATQGCKMVVDEICK